MKARMVRSIKTIMEPFLLERCSGMRIGQPDCCRQLFRQIIRRHMTFWEMLCILKLQDCLHQAIEFGRREPYQMMRLTGFPGSCKPIRERLCRIRWKGTIFQDILIERIVWGCVMRQQLFIMQILRISMVPEAHLNRCSMQRILQVPVLPSL